MAWSFRGHMTENCSCNMFCPCWFAVQEYMVMDQGWCAGTLTFQIEEGESEGVDLGGRTVTLAVDWPGPTLFDGNGTARVYIDDGASEEQVRELSGIFQGQKGGPAEIVAGLISTWLPVETTSIRASRDGDLITATIGSVGEVKSQALRDGDGNGFGLRGGGFVAALGVEEEAELAPSAGTKWSDPDMPREFETKSGARATVTWTG
jgi:hypothetical protein